MKRIGRSLGVRHKDGRSNGSQTPSHGGHPVPGVDLIPGVDLVPGLDPIPGLDLSPGLDLDPEVDLLHHVGRSQSVDLDPGDRDASQTTFIQVVRDRKDSIKGTDELRAAMYI